MSTQLGKMICYIALLLALACSLAAQDHQRVFKPYKPFDDPRPKLAAQITEDARLDAKVTVHVKSMNMKALFDGLSRATGVKLRVGQEIQSERPIVYMRDRPLRDVMVEVANLYGYYWLVKGTPGDRTYELFQDLRHAQKRAQLAREKLDMLNNCLMEAVKKGKELLGDPEAMRKAEQDNPAMAKSLADPANRDSLNILSLMDEALLGKVLTGSKLTVPTTDLSPEVQQAMLDSLNSGMKRWEDDRRANGEQSQDYQVYDMDDLRRTDMTIARKLHSVFGMPMFVMTIFRNGENRIRSSPLLAMWPKPFDMGLSELDLLAAMVDPGSAAEKVIGDPLPAKPGITIEKGSRIENGYAVRLGDALEAIADQAKLDIIADYYFHPVFMGTVNDRPVNEYVKDVCGAFGYTCQVEKTTLRFRSNSWFDVDLMQEPPAELVDRAWSSIETLGRPKIKDLLELAKLPEAQLAWGGLRFVPGVSRARLSPTSLRIWAMLTPAQEAAAKSEAGLNATDLSAEQQDKYYTWAKIIKPLISISDLAKSRLTIRTFDEGHLRYQVRMLTPDGTNPNVEIIMPDALSEKDRKELAAQRRADAAADKIERAAL